MELLSRRQPAPAKAAGQLHIVESMAAFAALQESGCLQPTDVTVVALYDVPAPAIVEVLACGADHIATSPAMLERIVTRVRAMLATLNAGEIARTEALARAALLEALGRIQRRCIVEASNAETFDALLAILLEVANSEYGFIGEINRRPSGAPYLKTHAITNIAWDDATRNFYETNAPSGLEFDNLDSLFGAVITSGAAVIANQPATDPRRTGLPEGHPAMHAFLGLPIHHGGSLVGMIGIANRPGGYNQTLAEDLSPLLSTIGVLIVAIREERLRTAAQADLRAGEERVRQLNLELEDRVRDRTAALATTADELRRFSYAVSHDLRAPLRSISGFAQALLEDYKDGLDRDAQHYIERIHHSTQRMAELIDDLLRLSGVSNAPFQRSPVVMASLIEEIVQEQQLARPEPSRQVTVAPLPDAFVDARLTRLLFEQLIGNAFKYSGGKHGAHIVIGAQPSEPTVYFVQDNGVGFDMAAADKLFGEFQRLHSAKEFEGNGIGLATAHRIVTRHGGHIWAAAKPNEGATFFCTLAPELPQKK